MDYNALDVESERGTLRKHLLLKANQWTPQAFWVFLGCPRKKYIIYIYVQLFEQIAKTLVMVSSLVSSGHIWTLLPRHLGFVLDLYVDCL